MEIIYAPCKNTLLYIGYLKISPPIKKLRPPLPLHFVKLTLFAPPPPPQNKFFVTPLPIINRMYHLHQYANWPPYIICLKILNLNYNFFSVASSGSPKSDKKRQNLPYFIK